MKRRVELGLLYSWTGSYSLFRDSSRAGALAAIDQINADPGLPIFFVPIECDPGGNAEAYGSLSEEILRVLARHTSGGGDDQRNRG